MGSRGVARRSRKLRRSGRPVASRAYRAAREEALWRRRSLDFGLGGAMSGSRAAKGEVTTSSIVGPSHGSVSWGVHDGFPEKGEQLNEINSLRQPPIIAGR